MPNKDSENKEISSGISSFMLWVTGLCASFIVLAVSYFIVQFIDFRTEIKSQTTSINEKLTYIADSLSKNVDNTDDNTKRIYALENKYDNLLTELKQQNIVKPDAKH